MANDFKHINRLHVLSSIQPWQLVQVMRKVLQLYRQHLNSPSAAGTKRRNHLLERIAQRHTDAVRLMSWLFVGGFTSEQLWDRIEEYFLGLPIEGFDNASACPESR